MKIKRVPIDTLSLDPANLRLHDERNVDAVKASLRLFGQQKPIVVSKAGVVVAGNCTLQAAKALGWSEIDTVETELAGPEAIAYAIADNRTAELAEWSDKELHDQLSSLADSGVSIEDLGWNESEFDRLQREFDPGTIEDKGNDAQKISDIVEATAPLEHGEVWKLGTSKLVVCSPVKDVALWRPLLDEGTEEFVPWCGFLAPQADKYAGRRVLFVQPDRTLAAIAVALYPGAERIKA